MNNKYQERHKSFWRDQDGFVAIFGALATPMLLMFAGLGVDFGKIYLARERLQLNVSRAALAGAQSLNPLTGSTVAVSNAASELTSNNKSNLMTVNQPTISLVCSNTVKSLAAVPTSMTNCVGSDKANAVQVTQTATVDLLFAQILGRKTQQISATAMAGGNIAGNPDSYNMMIIIDSTASMNSSDPNCSMTKINCALLGAQNLLKQLSPAIDQVGLMTFPGVQDATSVKNEYCSPSGTPKIDYYNSSPTYTILGIGSPEAANYRIGTPLASGLNTSSDFAKALGYAGTSCKGLQAIGGSGTYYADIINEAQAQLVATNKTGQKNVIVFLSDGDATATSSKVDPPSGPKKSVNECQAGVDAANAAKAAGTIVYSLAYDAGGAGTCSTDGGKITACQAMQRISSSPETFYSSTSSGPNSCPSTANPVMSNIAQAFADIPGRTIKPRLIPSNSP